MLGGRPALDFAQRALAERRHEARVLRQRAEDEVALRKCAATLTAALGARDAAERIQAEDYRLRMLIANYQEIRDKIVPGIFVRGPRGMGIPDEVTGMIAGRSGMWRVQVAISPKGQIWTDPSLWSLRSAGDPPSAHACAKASMAYAEGYNRAILGLPRTQTARVIRRVAAEQGDAHRDRRAPLPN
jgi:hypothetical protein